MKYEYGEEYQTNGQKPDLPDDVLVEYKNGYYKEEWLGPSKLKLLGFHDGIYPVKSFRIVDDRYKPASDTNVGTNWYKRGEFPPVGTFCEVNINRHGNSPMWGRCKFLGVEDGYVFWLEWNSDKIPCPCREYLDKVVGIFRPIPTERDVLVDEVSVMIHKWQIEDNTSALGLANRLYNAGWRPIKQQSEAEFVKETHDYLPDAMARTIYRAGCRFIEK